MKKFTETQLIALNKLFELDDKVLATFEKLETDKENEELEREWEDAKAEFAHYSHAYELIGLVTDEDYDYYYNEVL